MQDCIAEERCVTMSKLKAALEAAKITIRKYDPDKSRPVYTHTSSVTIGKFVGELVAALGSDIVHHAEIAACIRDNSLMEDLLEEYAEAEGLGVSSTAQTYIPPELSHLTLNIDRSSKETGTKSFFCTTPEEFVDLSHSGAFYINSLKITPQEATSLARAVVPIYLPRKGPGVHPEFDEVTKAMVPLFNTYIPPKWERWRRDNPSLWAKLPAKPPSDIIKLLKHVIPLKEEREYFYAWTYASLVNRAFVYLTLCGMPGVGKNRIKLVLRALHGEHNSTDGKKETFGANQSKFNSQMAENTLNWLDELEVTREMEPRMKEYQNPFISIERKGVDATRSTEIFCSMVISNNNLRDNYLPFDSRKFAPLVLGKKPLKEAMTEQEISVMSERLGESGNMDVRYVAQIAKWLLRVGPKYAGKFRNLEYQGPMFWEMAHASMSRWQKLVVLAMTTQNSRGPLQGWDETKGAFLWSKTEEALRRKKEFDLGHVHMATIRPFFEVYRDRMGHPVFEVEKVLDGVLDDFWVKPVGGLMRGAGRVSLNSKGSLKEVSPKLTRPPGTSQYQWRKMKDEYDAINGKGLENGPDEEDSDTDTDSL